MHIAFEGLIGAGKTTLATLFAEHIGAQTAFENFVGNKYLTDFYSDQERWALPMQLWFLSDRHNQFKEICASRDSLIVSDHSLAKSTIFSKILLKNRDIDLYKKISNIIQPTIQEPDLVIFLDASNEKLLQRIFNRGRAYEHAIDSKYLDKLRNEYISYFSGHKGKVIKYDTSNLIISSRNELEIFFELISRSIPNWEKL